MKQKLEYLAHECDQRLERELLPRLLAILREIDGERDAFEEIQRHAAHELRDQMNLLRCPASAVDDAVGQLHTVVPRYLSLLPTTSSLSLPSSDLTSLSEPGISTSQGGAFATPDSDTDGRAPGPSVVTLGTPSSHHTRSQRSQTKIRLPPTESRSLDNQALGSPTSALETSLSRCPQELTSPAQIEPPHTKRPDSDSRLLDEVMALTESNMVSHKHKRPSIDCHDESDTPCKRQKKTTSGVVESQETRRVAFSNLKLRECVFNHAELTGFFVIRCGYCEPGIFTDPPFIDNRALAHFQKHIEATSGDEELTNESIFEKFSYQVDGDKLVVKYWIQEHIGAVPHTFVPAKSSRRSSHVDNAQIVVRKHQEINDAYSPPSRKLRDSLRGRQSDLEAEPETPRRALRNQPRPDYAEMVAGGDPWNVPDVDTERAPLSFNVVRSSTSTKRRLTKPGIGTTAETTEKYAGCPRPRSSC
ncbi:hypothetical protein F4861DRAFT_518764 [Xylaria intraflava]|nr:hypothetical protein F4861DRAFT_518764 [Xylaria intraflava]